MTLYIRLSDSVIGLAPAAVRQTLPSEVSFVDGADLTDWGYAPYAETARPAPGWWQTVVEAAPVAGEQVWAVADRADDQEALKAERLEALAERRKFASQNFTFNGMAMKLDPDTENAISKAIMSLERQPEGIVINWEVTRGEIVPLDLATLHAIGDAAFVHVQACFTNVAAITALILAAPDGEALDAVDLDVGWP